MTTALFAPMFEIALVVGLALLMHFLPLWTRPDVFFAVTLEPSFRRNPDDPALFVEKRFGIGYTVNFGNVWSWVILGLVIVVPVVLSFGMASSN